MKQPNPNQARQTTTAAARLAIAAATIFTFTTTIALANNNNPTPPNPPSPAQPAPIPPAEQPKIQPEPQPEPQQESQQQPESKKPEEPKTTTPPRPAPRPSSDIPSLDDILGITESTPPPTDESEPADIKQFTPDQIADRFREQLERDLAGLSLGDQFQQIVTLLEDAATRLDPAQTAPDTFTGDPGLTTQRIQQSALDRLDALIEQAQQQQQQQSSSSSSSRRQQQQQQQMPQQGQQQQQASSEGDNQQEAQPPARQEGPLRPTLEAARAAWGSLPERVRDTLLQGSGDTFSSMYERLTESYYRKVAEEASR